jgi:hypothetical protein
VPLAQKRQMQHEVADLLYALVGHQRTHIQMWPSLAAAFRMDPGLIGKATRGLWHRIIGKVGLTLPQTRTE